MWRGSARIINHCPSIRGVVIRRAAPLVADHRTSYCPAAGSGWFLSTVRCAVIHAVPIATAAGGITVKLRITCGCTVLGHRGHRHAIALACRQRKVAVVIHPACTTATGISRRGRSAFGDIAAGPASTHHQHLCRAGDIGRRNPTAGRRRSEFLVLGQRHVGNHRATDVDRTVGSRQRGTRCQKIEISRVVLGTRGGYTCGTGTQPGCAGSRHIQAGQ